MISELKILTLSMMPISELRGSIPFGVAVLKMPFWKVFFISIIGNLIIVIFLLIFLKPIVEYLSKKSKIFENFFIWLFERTRKKTKFKIEKYGSLALALFVAIPLPVTGGWTGSIAAFLFGIPILKSFFSISIGILIAGVIISFFTLTGTAISQIFGWQTLIVILCFGFLLYYSIFFLKSKMKKKK